jgi:hypothetical protein
LVSAAAATIDGSPEAEQQRLAVQRWSVRSSAADMENRGQHPRSLRRSVVTDGFKQFSCGACGIGGKPSDHVGWRTENNESPRHLARLGISAADGAASLVIPDARRRQRLFLAGSIRG